MAQLGNLLVKLREEDLSSTKDIDQIENLLKDPGFVNLCKVNDMVCKSQGYDQPEGDACRIISEVFQ